MSRIAVCLEVGSKRVFASALDWPGWARSGKDEQQALDALRAYAPRYAVVAEEAGLELPKKIELEVVERVPGSASTEFGVPGEAVAAEKKDLTAAEADRLARLIEAAWRVFDRTVAKAPAELRKGPRGGGRDRDKIAAHVLDAEGGAYAGKLGLRLKPPPAADKPAVAAFRAELAQAIRQARKAEPAKAKGWLPRYAARRIAWHVTDHTWEIEDRS